MNDKQTRQIPAIVVRVGGRPTCTTIEYIRYGDTGWEPTNGSLHDLIPAADLLERVSLAPGYDLWCDEEGRLKDGAKASCVAAAPWYQGDIAGDCVLALDLTIRPYAVLADLPTTEGITDIAKQLLIGFGRQHIGPVPDEHVLAEPSITLRCMICNEELVGNEGCSCDRKDDEKEVVH